MGRIKDRWAQYKAWQRAPYSVAPMSEEECVCATCETHFRGNFCPRCGQSAQVQPKMTLWKTILLFLDVWGFGNRGMFRTLRDLIFRPGYLICDYIRGRHNAYYPPFNLLFLLTTISLLVGHGFNLMHKDFQQDIEPLTIESDLEAAHKLIDWFNVAFQFQRDYPALFQLCFMLLGGYFFYIFFRKSKVVGRLSFHEFFIGLVYMVNMFILYNTTFRFFGLDKFYSLYLVFLYIIPLKQLSGYSWWSTFWRAFCGVVLIVAAFALLFFALVCFAVLIYHRPEGG